MKIYFAGSIFGGRENVYLYKQIIDLLKKYGEVLTEDVVGNEKYVAVSEKEGVPDDEYIYTRDTKWIESADILIADVTVPSIGVGYEIGFAEAQGKKILCIYQEGGNKKLSFMVSGNKNIITKTYKTIEDLELIFEKFL
jgi:nucleoside 2-deoxyribosyltransferase